MEHQRVSHLLDDLSHRLEEVRQKIAMTRVEVDDLRRVPVDTLARLRLPEHRLRLPH